jgi:hypothetical protein
MRMHATSTSKALKIARVIVPVYLDVGLSIVVLGVPCHGVDANHGVSQAVTIPLCRHGN